MNRYAKAAWVVESGIYALTGRMEQAKGLNLALLVASGMLCFSALRFRGWPSRTALIVASLLALNPVAVCQSASLYVDGQVASTMLAVVALVAAFLVRPSFWVGFALSLTTLYAVNLKFTAPLYLGVMALPLVVLAIRPGGRPSRQVILALSLGAVVGCVGPGWNPYVTNTLQDGHPLSPILGPKAVDIISTQMPAEFLARSRAEQLVRGVLSTASNALDANPQLKVPFTVTSTELKSFVDADLRIGGFGPWFGPAMLLALALAFGLARRVASSRWWLGALAIVCGTVLLNPAPWWARYVPQLWWIPVAVGALAFRSELPWPKRAGTVVLVLLAVNLALVGAPFLRGQIQRTRELRRELRELAAASEGHRVVADLRGVAGQGTRLTEAGITFQESPLSCAAPLVFQRWPNIRFCIDPHE